MSKQRDMSTADFLAALRRHGMVQIGFLGYVGIAGEPNPQRHCVSWLNGGPTWRARLAYLLAQQEKFAAADAAAERRSA